MNLELKTEKMSLQLTISIPAITAISLGGAALITLIKKSK